VIIDVSEQTMGPNFKGDVDFLTSSDGTESSPETSGTNYQPTPPNTAEERRSQQHCGESLESSSDLVCEVIPILFLVADN
jgi:hypothetical protein